MPLVIEAPLPQMLARCLQHLPRSNSLLECNGADGHARCGVQEVRSLRGIASTQRFP